MDEKSINISIQIIIYIFNTVKIDFNLKLLKVCDSIWIKHLSEH